MTTELFTMLGIGIAIVGLNWRMVHGLATGNARGL